MTIISIVVFPGGRALPLRRGVRLRLLRGVPRQGNGNNNTTTTTTNNNDDDNSNNSSL